MIKTCQYCNEEFSSPRNEAKFCSRKCYASVPKTKETKDKVSKANKGRKKPPGHGAKVSEASRGKPKPWVKGDKNPNYQNKAQNKVRDKFLASVAARGQAWTSEHRKQHSERMLGSINAMRGKKHSEETKQQVSVAKKKQYADGIVKIKKYKISQPEKEIHNLLVVNNIEFKKQFHIKGVSYLYDFMLCDMHVIIEFQGNYWHANPRMYSSDHEFQFGVKRQIAKEIWERDLQKKLAAESHGYKVLYIWENDYKKLGAEKVLQQALLKAL